MSEKTEQPTHKRLRDARKKGQVANSRDVTSAALVVVIFAYLGITNETIIKKMLEMIQLPAMFFGAPFNQAVDQTLDGIFKTMASIIFPLILAVMITGVAGNFFQVGVLFAFESIKPDIKKLNPISKLKNMFSIKNLIEFLKSVIKIVFLSVLIYILIKNLIDPMLKIPFTGLWAFIDSIRPVLKDFAYNVSAAYIIVAFLDFIFQKKNHIKQLKMSKDEVKREYKEQEGDPQIKGKRKQMHRELMEGKGGAVAKTRKSSVLVTNPTHYAIALFYDGGILTPLPVVLAKGFGSLAQQMKKVALEENIPIMENVPLAHALYDFAEEGRFIPRDLIEPVAEVIRWLNERKKIEEDTI